jgi:hypothetical protein
LHKEPLASTSRFLPCLYNAPFLMGSVLRIAFTIAVVSQNLDFLEALRSAITDQLGSAWETGQFA